MLMCTLWPDMCAERYCTCVCVAGKLHGTLHIDVHGKRDVEGEGDADVGVGACQRFANAPLTLDCASPPFGRASPLRWMAGACRALHGDAAADGSEALPRPPVGVSDDDDGRDEEHTRDKVASWLDQWRINKERVDKRA